MKTKLTKIHLWVGIGIVILVGIVYWGVATMMPRSFDPAIWQAQRGVRNSSIRYQMRESVISNIKNNHWNIQEIIRNLGVPDSSNMEVNENDPRHLQISYGLGTGLLFPKQFHLRIIFNEKGSIEVILIHPE